MLDRIKKLEKRVVDLYNKLKNLPSGEGVDSVNGQTGAVVIDISSKLDKVTTVDVEKVYIKNADGTQGVKSISELEGIIYKNANINTTLTGTSVETRLLVTEIGVVGVNDFINIEELLFTQELSPMPPNGSGVITIRIRISDTPTMPTDENSIIATLNFQSNFNSFDAFAKLKRTFIFRLFSETQYKVICYTNSFSSNTDEANTFNYSVNTFGQLTNTKFIHITAQLPVSDNNCTLRSLIIKKL